jgi:hypothetical protein
VPDLVCEQDGEEQSITLCYCLTCAQAGVRLGIVVKEKDVFRVSVRTKSTDALPQFVYSSLVPLDMCCEVEEGNFTALVYSALHDVGKSVLKMTKTMSQK